MSPKSAYLGLFFFLAGSSCDFANTTSLFPAFFFFIVPRFIARRASTARVLLAFRVAVENGEKIKPPGQVVNSRSRYFCLAAGGEASPRWPPRGRPHAFSCSRQTLIHPDAPSSVIFLFCFFFPPPPLLGLTECIPCQESAAGRDGCKLSPFANQ